MVRGETAVNLPRPTSLLAALAIVAAASTVPTRAANAADCDRACLESMVDRYVDALIAHDPAKIPVTDCLLYTSPSPRDS